MTFDELLKKLPSCPGPSALPLTASQEFSYCAEGSEDYVPPPLKVRPDATSETPEILILSAPGAVGKSAMARELAFRKGAPLWDLAGTGTVGARTVAGQLTTSFGASGLSAVHGALGAGNLFLVIDALDEARIKTTEAGFLEFVKDLAGLPGAMGTCKVVLLGRTQIADTAWLMLNEAGASVEIDIIEPFTDAQAAQYVDLRVARLNGAGSAAAQTHKEKFVSARAAIFAELRNAFSASTDASAKAQATSFLGYAPVLDAVATLLANEPNFEVLASSLKQSTASSNKALALLGKIIDHILTREQDDKLTKNIRPSLAAEAKSNGWSGWNSLYTKDEQCVRLLSLILGTRSALLPRLPGSLQAIYEDRVSAFLPEHPFLHDGLRPANVVFESYLFARALAQDLGGMRGPAEARLRATEYKPSRLLADFYQLELGERTIGIPPSHVGLLYDALLAGESENQHLRATVEGADPEDGLADTSVAGCEFEYLTKDGDSRWKWEFETSSLQRDSELRFRRFLRDISVTVPCAVVLGDHAEEFEIGPAVEINCAHLSIPCRSLVVGGKTRTHSAEAEDLEVVLRAQSFESSLTSKPRVHVGFKVTWPGSQQFPWTDFHAPDPIGSGDDLHEVYRRFRRIVMTLRSHSRGTLARFKGKIEHQRILKGAMGEQLLARLLRDGVLVLDGRMYRWVPTNATEHVGVSHHDLRVGQVPPILRNYLQAFLRDFQTAGV